MKKIKTAILISGRGSNMQSLIEACKNESFPAEISLVISNKENAKGLEVAKNEGITTKFINHKDFSSRVEFDRQVSKEIESHDCEIVCLAGFMRLLSGEFTKKWTGKAINIHPSLLPEFKGGNAVKDAFEAGVKKSGCTVHHLVEDMDAGEIIKQAEVDILDGDSLDDVKARILEQEHKIYPEALKMICVDLLKST